MIFIGKCSTLTNLEDVTTFLHSKTDIGFRHIIVLDSSTDPCLEHLQCSQLYLNLLNLSKHPVGLLPFQLGYGYEDFSNILFVIWDNLMPSLEDLFGCLNRTDLAENVWLFFFEDTNVVVDACESSKGLTFDLQVYVSNPSLQISELFRTNSDGHPINQKVVMFKSIWERRNDFGGLKLRATYVEEYPWSYIEQKKIVGLDAQKFELLRTDLNFTVEFIPSPVYGTYSEASIVCFTLVILIKFRA